MGSFTTVSLAHGDRQSVKLIEEPRPVCLIIGRESQTCESNHGLVSLAVIDGRGLEKLVAFCDAAQILVSDRDRMAEGVKQDGVGCFRTDAGEGQQAFAQLIGGAGGEAIEGT